MTILLAELGLALALAITVQVSEPERTVALLFSDGQGIVIISVTNAEKEYGMLLTVDPEDRTEMQQQRFAALVWALGTVPNNKAIPCPEDHAPRCRVLESGGRRLPLQRN